MLAEVCMCRNCFKPVNMITGFMHAQVVVAKGCSGVNEGSDLTG